MSAEEFYMRPLRRLKWGILSLAILFLTALRAYHHFVQDVSLGTNLVDWLIETAIVVVLSEVTFRAMANSQRRLQREVTDCKRAEKALQERERRLRAVVTGAPIFLFATDCEGVITLAESKGLQALGVKPGEIIGRLASDLFQDVPQAGQEIRRALKGEEFTSVVQVVGRTFEAWFSPLLDQADEISGVIGVVTDIAGQQQAKEALQYRVALEKLVTTISTEFVDLAPSKVETGINHTLQAVGELVGVDRSYIFLLSDGGTKMHNLHEWCAAGIEPQIENLQGLPADTFPWWMKKLNRFEHIHIPRVADLPAEARSEKEILQAQSIQSLVVVPMVYGRTLVGFLGFDSVRAEKTWAEEDIRLLKTVGKIFINALERKQAEEALRESEERYRAVAETAIDAVITVDSRGNIVFWNPAAETIFGYPADEAIGQSLTIVIPDKSSRVYRNIMMPAFSTGESSLIGKTIEASGLRKDGSELPLELSLATWKTRGQVFFTSVMRDITERKQMEMDLEEERALLARRVAERTAELSAANAELARASHLKDEFLASMSHELRTPLNTILGLSEALQEEVYGPLTERQSKSLHSIEESGHLLLALINDILDVSKIEAGKLELEVRPVSVETVCQASLRLIKQNVHKKRLKVSSILDDAVTTIQADERRLKQVLVNLLSNAVKFTPEGGTIGLEVVGDVEHETAHFVVWDTGIGIASQDVAQLFGGPGQSPQPFIQLDSSLSRQYAGTGLGLALVHRLAEMHGGSISLESEPGKGSRFTVSLPWKEAVAGSGLRPEAQPKGSKVAGSMSSDLRPSTWQPPDLQSLILLAEDNMENIDAFSDYLQAKGYRIVVARDGSEVLERAREERPDLILMDIQMPGMDGLEATRRIRADADLATIPIIALTALAMPGDRERCLQAGANAYLSKPVSLKRLIKMIEVQVKQEAK